MSFIQGKSLAEEKELKFRQQSNEEFQAQKKQQQQVKDVSKRTCFKCDQTGHLARKCPNLKSVGVETKKKSVYVQKQKYEVVNQKSTKFESKQTWKSKLSKADSQQTWKPVTPELRTTQSWKTTVDATKPNQFWKPKDVVQSPNVQKESNFYKRGTPKGQTWSVKKHVDLVKNEKQKQIWKSKTETESSTYEVKKAEESISIDYDANFPPLKAENFKIQVARVKVTPKAGEAWVDTMFD